LLTPFTALLVLGSMDKIKFLVKDLLYIKLKIKLLKKMGTSWSEFCCCSRSATLIDTDSQESEGLALMKYLYANAAMPEKEIQVLLTSCKKKPS
jgi:hypothetical protein